MFVLERTDDQGIFDFRRSGLRAPAGIMREQNGILPVPTNVAVTNSGVEELCGSSENLRPFHRQIELENQVEFSEKNRGQVTGSSGQWRVIR